jgi:hypothetical protein
MVDLKKSGTSDKFFRARGITVRPHSSDFSGAFLLYYSTCILFARSFTSGMSYQAIYPDAEHAAEPPQRRESMWRSAWNNNKGACLILLAELAGASMDAMARYLQQGDTKYHPFQVRMPTLRLFTEH